MRPFDFNLEVDGPVSNESDLRDCGGLFLLYVVVDLPLLFFELRRCLLLSIRQFRLLCLDLAASLLKLQSFLLEDPFSFGKVLLLLYDDGLARAQLSLLLRR